MPRADFWIENIGHCPDPDAATDSEGIPWQASQMWQPAGFKPPSAVHIRTTAPPPPDDPPF